MSDIDDIQINPVENETQNLFDDNERQVQVRFVRSSSAPNLPLAPTSAFSVPVKQARLGLSELLNHIIGQGANRAYEFLVNNRFLRSSLEKYLSANGLSGESELELEYLEALPPPQRDTSTPHPDWISSVCASLGVDSVVPNDQSLQVKKRKKSDGNASEAIDQALSVTGCYDHLVRVWAAPLDEKASPSCTLVAQGAGHLGPVTSVAVACPYQSQKSKGGLVVSASHDRTLRLWGYSGAGEAAKLACKGVFDYHIGTVQCVDTLYNPNLNGSMVDHSLTSDEQALGCVRFVSGGYDNALALWVNHDDYLIDAKDVENRTELMYKGMGQKLKQQKTMAKQAQAKTDLSAEAQLKHYRPVAALLGHKGPVACLQWASQDNVYSGSYDYTLKMWDLNESVAVHSWSSGHVVNAVDFSHNMNLIATGEQDGFVRLYDPRIGSSDKISTSKGGFKGCATWISAVKWAPAAAGAPYLLASAGYDGQFKTWDIRSSKPLYSVDTNSERLLGLDWVPVNQAVDGSMTQLYAMVGGTGKSLDRVSWKVNI